MSRVRPPFAVVLGIALLVTAACTATVRGQATSVGPVATQMPPPPALLSDVLAAANEAKAVHIKGTVSDGNESVRLDVQLNADSTGQGTVAENGVAIPLIASQAGNYVQFTAAVESVENLTPSTGPGARALNKWIPAASPLLAQSKIQQTFNNLQYHTLVPAIFSGLRNEHLQQLGPDTLEGTPVHTYKFSEGTLIITDTAPHYVLRVVGTSNRDSGQVDFTNWNHPEKIAAPPTNQIYTGN